MDNITITNTNYKKSIKRLISIYKHKIKIYTSMR